MRARCASPGRQRGLSLVELMVGLAAGLGVLAGAAALAAAQVNEQRQMLLEARLQQDLRAAMDIVARDLRRAGAWREAAAGLAQPDADAPSRTNPFLAMQTAGAPRAWVRHAWDRGPALSSAQGFRLVEGSLQTLVGTAWQALTDPQALRVTSFVIAPLPQASVVVPCPRACPQGGRDCWPRASRRLLALEIVAQAPGAPAIERRLATRVQLRNDLVEGHCP